MTGRRVLVSARCRDRGHLLAQLVAEADGRVYLEMSRVAVVDVRNGRTYVRDDIGTRVALDDPTGRDRRHAACACGYQFDVSPAELERAARPVRMVAVEGVRVRVEQDPPTKAPVLRLAPTRRRR